VLYDEITNGQTSFPCYDLFQGDFQQTIENFKSPSRLEMKFVAIKFLIFFQKI
jgi:hypothetical protein